MNTTFEIPLEEKYNFKARCEPLHSKWLDTLRASDKHSSKDEPAAKAEEPATKEPEVKQNGVNGDVAKENAAPAEEKKGETPTTIKEVAMGDAPPTAAAEEKEAEKAKEVEAEA
jgi:hypothetical protein